MSRRSRGVLTGALSALLLLGFSGTASAAGEGDDPGPAIVNAGPTGENSQGFGAQQQSNGQSAPSSGSPDSGASNTSYQPTSSAPVTTPPADLDADDGEGPQRRPLHDAGGRGLLRQRLGRRRLERAVRPAHSVRTDRRPGAWRPPARPQITAAMVTAAASVVAPTSPPHVEPGEVSYVHVPNNYWTDAPTVNNSLTLLGVTIPLRWTPVATTWNFGDGSSATGNGVAGANVGAPGAVEHAYDRQGSYDITTSTSYNLTFVLPGQGAQTVQLHLSSQPSGHAARRRSPDARRLRRLRATTCAPWPFGPIPASWAGSSPYS